MKCSVRPAVFLQPLSILLDGVSHGVRIKLDHDPVIGYELQEVRVAIEVRIEHIRRQNLPVLFRVSEEREYTGIQDHRTIAEMLCKPQQIADRAYSNTKRVRTDQCSRRVLNEHGRSTFDAMLCECWIRDHGRLLGGGAGVPCGRLLDGGGPLHPPPLGAAVPDVTKTIKTRIRKRIS